MPDITELLIPNSNTNIQDEILSSEGEVDEGSFPNLESDEELEYKATRQTKRSGASFSQMGFSKLILANIKRKGYKHPTPIQRKSIPIILDGDDVVGMARTGSGKTAAFVLPMIEKLKTHSGKVGARALILSPSRELALQTLKVVKELSKKTELVSVLLVGGDSLEDQFGFMMNNPDIIIATPGRFLHLQVEMRLNLSTIEYVVFDEADRLFEMGFAEQLNEILISLPEARQTLLFSATLPSTLVEFAKAGLSNPKLVRLDAEQKISDQLQMAFFGVKDFEKDAALLFILENVIKLVPSNVEKDKATIVFVPTKHHVEYIAEMLRHQGYAVSFIYGSLDQTARKEQLESFRENRTNVLVVTDVAARGVDIPLLGNVINYNMTTSARVFVHRVGRTARAGHTGWAYTLVKQADLPYLADLEVFLGRKVSGSGPDYAQKLVLGSLPRDGVEFHAEQVQNLLDAISDISELRNVSLRSEKLYNKTREAASRVGLSTAKKSLLGLWEACHPLFVREQEAETVKESFLAQLRNRKNKETVFEFKKNGQGSLAEMMARRRAVLEPIQERAQKRLEEAANSSTFQDESNFISHFEPTESLQERGYSLQGTAGFNDQTRKSTYNLNDEGKDFAQKQIVRWDKKKGKYVNSSGEKKVKYIVGENGRKIPASLRSGRFEAWSKSNKSTGPELYNKYQHRKERAPKPADKARDDYKQRKERVDQALSKGLRVKGVTQAKPTTGLNSTRTIQKQRASKQKRWEKSNQPGRQSRDASSGRSAKNKLR